MRFNASIPDLERRQLALLIGQNLAAISTNGWAVQLGTDYYDVFIIPEEIWTPDDDHKSATVDRPKIAEPIDSGIGMEIIASELGIITSVSILSTVVTFSPPKMGEPIKFRGVTIPEGIEYGPVFSHPSQSPRVDSREAIVDLDIAFELLTDVNNRLTVHTGRGFFALVAVNEEPIAPEICQRTELVAG
jgi:hypothetical protein